MPVLYYQRTKLPTGTDFAVLTDPNTYLPTRLLIEALWGSSPTKSAMALWYKGNYIRLSIGRFGFDSQ